MGQLPKMGISRNAVRERTGGWKQTGRGSITASLYFQTHFLSAPLHRLSTAKTLGPEQLCERSSGCSLMQPPLRRCPSCLLHQWLREAQKPGQVIQMCFSGLAGEPVASA